MCPEDAASLELNFSLPEVQLDPNSSFTAVPDGVSTEEQGSTSTLRLHNASWSQAGRYACEEPSSRCKRFALFPPPVGPEEWFVPGGGGTVTKVGEEGTIPCAVSDPRLNVSLYERDGREPVGAVRYHAAQGFSGPLNDSPYRCVARGDGQEKTSRTYYVFSIIGPCSRSRWSGPDRSIWSVML
uniref:Ig-like domain-containing protein n=1 Tax=Gadus morhua TaxID=8049 RepID=A0A8C5BFM4_GADMO